MFGLRFAREARTPGEAPRHAVVLLLAAALALLPGCEQIVRQFIPVQGDDAQAPLPDAVFAIDGDGFMLDKLTLGGAKPGHILASLAGFGVIGAWLVASQSYRLRRIFAFLDPRLEIVSTPFLVDSLEASN